jgi:hypothetical protein
MPELRTYYRGFNTRNSLPSGSDMITQPTGPWPKSTSVAPSGTKRDHLQMLIAGVGRDDVELKPVLADLRYVRSAAPA